MFPMNHVRADGVGPSHVTPFVSLRINLVEQMILSLVKNHPIWIVHPILFRSEMKLRAKTLRVSCRDSLCAEPKLRRAENQRGDHYVSRTTKHLAPHPREMPTRIAAARHANEMQ